MSYDAWWAGFTLSRLEVCQGAGESTTKWENPAEIGILGQSAPWMTSLSKSWLLGKQSRWISNPLSASSQSTPRINCNWAWIGSVCSTSTSLEPRPLLFPQRWMYCITSTRKVSLIPRPHPRGGKRILWFWAKSLVQLTTCREICVYPIRSQLPLSHMTH